MEQKRDEIPAESSRDKSGHSVEEGVEVRGCARRL